MLIACVDVDYRSDAAVAAGVWLRGWSGASPEAEAVATFPDVAAYEPGAFYKRELPCLLGVLARGPQADVVVVDGYVWLAAGAPGLGAHLHTATGRTIVGVAKTRFAGATDAVALCRGTSRLPLFVTAVGMTAGEAAAHVAAMHGPFRIPTLLKRADTLARTAKCTIEPGS